METTDKSSRTDQTQKSPEIRTNRSGKMRLIPEVVIEKKIEKSILRRDQDRVPDSLDREVKNKAEERSDNSQKTPKQHNRNELPFKDVPPIVSAPSIRPKEAKRRQVRFDVSERKSEPNFRRRAQVEASTSFENVSKTVLKQPITLSLGDLAGVSPGVRETLRNSFTRKRIAQEVYHTSELPGNVFDDEEDLEIEEVDEELVSEVEHVVLPPPTVTVNLIEGNGVPVGGLIVSDPLSQYLETIDEEAREKIIVAKDSESLRAVWPEINDMNREECILDWGSQIVAMSLESATKLSVAWDPSVKIHMQSANGQLELSEGLARNVPFRFGHVIAYLQVHVLKGVAYKVLLGRPFEVLTLAQTNALEGGGQLLKLRDPNTKACIVIPTSERGGKVKVEDDDDVKKEDSAKVEDFH